MSSNRLGVAVVALVGLIAASSTHSPPVLRHPAARAGGAPLMAFGGRSAVQLASGVGGKLDAALADLTRHAHRARRAHALEDLHSLSPAAHFLQHGAGGEPLVAIDAVTRGDPQLLKNALVRLGLEHPSVFRNDVGGWLPVSAIDAAAARAEVATLRAALSRVRAPVATQGDFAQDSAAVRAAEGLNGAGVTVGVLSSSFDCYSVYAANQGQTFSGVPDPPAGGTTGYASNGFTADAAADVTSGALPAGVIVLEEAGATGVSPGCVTTFGYPQQLPYSDEGRAMMQIVHAVAPGAGLAFYTADITEADFANGILKLASATASGGAGAKVITDDVGYFDEPFFQDGIIAQAIDTVAGQGVAYFSAAGNESNLAYDNTAPGFSIAGSGAQTGEMLLNFDATGKTSAPALTVSVPPLFPGEFIAVVLEWDQPYLAGAYPGTSGSTPGATSQLDLCVTAPGLDVYSYPNFPQAATCTGPNAVGTDPVQILIVGNPANASGNTASVTVSVSVGLVSGSPAPGRIKLVWEDDGGGSTITNFPPTNNATIQGHPGAAGAAAVGAAFFADTPLCGVVTKAQLEYFSSFGGTPILFDTSGNRLATPVVRQKPDFVTADGVNNTFLGFTLASATPPIQDNSTVPQCANNGSFPNFFGTSAAAPHAAGLAALMLQANSAVTPTDIYDAIRFTAAAMVSSSPDFTTGYGMIQAGPALAWPNMSVSPTTIALGQSATLSWNAASFNTCMATAGFTSSAISGSLSVTPTIVGTSSYSMKCTNATGVATESIALVVQGTAPALSVTTSSLPNGQMGVAYSAMLAASGGTAPYTWTLTSGALPGGLSLGSNGAITGTPTASASNVALTFKVSDSGSPAQSLSANLSLTIAPASSGGGGGGGGALDELTLLALGGLSLLRRRRLMPD